ncbi:hypothetical protein F4813DRAFT_395812 [Daldinia decipiens]|uniref:uncharacterized protein n=1 Tax=Daldinia decipiens TaxID=326647 RepID=UPI0020C29EA9|nr:uncharacterized protein F4813DRAFT_395812 [Daldinia decipiens]KAI1658552.1 hypothetical protein F4813DRAFT_395812 [Daldinia decipiens]
MSLHRWSLPSRAFSREKPKDGDPNHRTRFPTIHIGDTITRRRANISSAFANLFEKDENCTNTAENSCACLTSNDLRPLSCIENITSSTRSKVTKRDDGSDRIGKAALKMSGVITRFPSGQEVSLQETLQESNTRNPFNDHNHVKSSEGSASDDDSPTSLTRVRSASSSYPSEGIRSPPDHCASPRLDTWTEDFIADVSHYGTYPLGNPPSKSSASTNDVSVLGNRAGKCLMEELAAAGGVSDTDTRTASRGYTPRPPLSDVASASCPREQLDKDYDSDHFATARQELLDVSQRAILSVLDGQGPSTSAIHGSYPDLGLSHTSSSDEEFPFRSNHTSSMDHLRRSAETCRTHFPKKIHWKNQGNTYHTMPAAIARDGSRRGRLPEVSPPLASTLQPGFHYRESNSSSTTLVKRIQKFKFKKWIKRSYRSRKSKRQGGAYKAKAKPTKSRWKSFKTTNKTNKSTQGREGMAHRFMNSLRPKHSIQFPIREKSKAEHRRVQSCPP